MGDLGGFPVPLSPQVCRAPSSPSTRTAWRWHRARTPPSNAASTMAPGPSTSLGGWDLANISKVWWSPGWPRHDPQGDPGVDSSSLPRQREDQHQRLGHLHHRRPRGQPGRLPLRGLQPLRRRQQRRQPPGARCEVARVAPSLSPCAPDAPRVVVSPSPSPCWCLPCAPDTPGVVVSPSPCPPCAPGAPGVVVSLSPCWCLPCAPDAPGVMVSPSPCPLHASGASGVVVPMSPC